MKTRSCPNCQQALSVSRHVIEKITWTSEEGKEISKRVDYSTDDLPTHWTCVGCNNQVEITDTEFKVIDPGAS